MNTLCWTPSRDLIKNANMTRFIDYINSATQRNISGYDELYKWSIKDSEHFWGLLWKFFEIVVSKPVTKVVDNIHKMPGAKWFIGCRLNFAENLLKFRDEKIAISFIGEGRKPVHISYRGLFQKVTQLANALRNEGVREGDRVSGFVSNQIETVIAMLATTSLGAVWSSCSSDFGTASVYDRFSQIQPKVLFTVTGYQYNGKVFDVIEKIKPIVQRIKSIKKVITIPYHTVDIISIKHWTDINTYFTNNSIDNFSFTQVSASHPLFIMFSSGTTGIPKCIVHSVGGTLIQHLKELVLHTNLKRKDTIFYYTTCGWMMWNWLISSLAVGARIVLYDGSPFYPSKDYLWKMVETEKVTIFGTSAKYLSAIEKEKVVPKNWDLTSLRTILSTGSTLSEDSFDYVYNKIKEDVQLSSISGGTDIISCFALGNPLLPVYRGELQCRGLGMKVEANNARGQSVINKKGELICTAAAPSMPVCFWNDTNREKFTKAYFSVYPNVWHHGDYIKITDHGGVIIYGRSDATLNPGGVRIGTAEIYRQVETIEEVEDSIVVGFTANTDEIIVLFVKLYKGEELNDLLIKKIQTRIKSNTSSRHVPSKIIATPDIPYTISGKKVELAVKKLIHKEEIDNTDALANPQSLDFYRTVKLQ